MWQGYHSAPVTGVAEVATTETNRGWRVAFVVPWTEYDVQPIVGSRLGLDVHIGVRDGSERIAKVGWFDESDEAWENPQAFATIELGE